MALWLRDTRIGIIIVVALFIITIITITKTITWGIVIFGVQDSILLYKQYRDQEIGKDGHINKSVLEDSIPKGSPDLGR